MRISAACVPLLLAACAPPPRPAVRPDIVASVVVPTMRAELPAADRVRIAEALHLAAAIGDRIWPAWTTAPFALLLVTQDQEFLINHPNPSLDFTRIGYDSMLKSDIFVRPRVFSPNLLATFPAVEGVPTIVIGQAATTHKSSTAWVLTVLHEHFHQMQYSRPGYNEGVAALNLARGDQTGMWMLNYAFPYDSAQAQTAYATLANAVLAAINWKGDPNVTNIAGDRAIFDAQQELRAQISPDDYKYFTFQLWQEGVARYTELAAARFAAAGYTPSAPFAALPDYTTYAAQSALLDGQIVSELTNNRLASAQRVVFYPLGAAMALLFDRESPDWRQHYFEHPFTLDR